MFSAYRCKDDNNLVLLTEILHFPRHFDIKYWDLESEKANVTDDIADEITQRGFVLMRSNLPIGQVSTYGLMPNVA